MKMENKNSQWFKFNPPTNKINKKRLALENGAFTQQAQLQNAAVTDLNPENIFSEIKFGQWRSQPEQMTLFQLKNAQIKIKLEIRRRCFKTRLCWYHQNSVCLFGKECRFAHRIEDLRKMIEDDTSTNIELQQQQFQQLKILPPVRESQCDNTNGSDMQSGTSIQLEKQTQDVNIPQNFEKSLKPETQNNKMENQNQQDENLQQFKGDDSLDKEEIYGEKDTGESFDSESEQWIDEEDFTQQINYSNDNQEEGQQNANGTEFFENDSNQQSLFSKKEMRSQDLRFARAMRQRQRRFGKIWKIDPQLREILMEP